MNAIVMDRDYVFNTLPQKKRWKAKAQVLFKPLTGPLASNFYRSMGDTSSIVLNRTIEESEVYSNETPRKDLAVLSVNRAEPGLTIGFRQMTDVLQSLVFMSDPAKRNQLAAVDHEIDIVDAVPGDVIRLDHQDISAIEIVAAGAGAAPYLIGLHYQIDASGGSVEILAHPGGATKGSLTITYDADAIVGREEYGLMDNVDPRFAILIRQNNLWGPSHEYEFWNGQARVDGDVPLSQDGDDFGEGSVKVRLFADPLRPSKFRYGRVRTVASVS